MKKILFILATLLCLGATAKTVVITNVDKVQPTDEMFMDMAVTAAKKSAASNNVPSGAVIILNGAWRATGIPENGKTAEEVAVSKSRLTKLKNASVYTVNQPTSEVINMLSELGVDAIYFANGKEAVIAAGIYPASAYDEELINADIKQAPVMRLPLTDAAALLKKK